MTRSKISIKRLLKTQRSDPCQYTCLDISQTMVSLCQQKIRPYVIRARLVKRARQAKPAKRSKPSINTRQLQHQQWHIVHNMQIISYGVASQVIIAWKK